MGRVRSPTPTTRLEVIPLTHISWQDDSDEQLDFTMAFVSTAADDTGYGGSEQKTASFVQHIIHQGQVSSGAAAGTILVSQTALGQLTMRPSTAGLAVLMTGGGLGMGRTSLRGSSTSPSVSSKLPNRSSGRCPLTPDTAA